MWAATESELRLLFLFQKYFSLFSAVAMLLFPFYIFYMTGWVEMPIHDLNSGTTYYASSVLAALPISVVGISVSVACYWATRQALSTKSDPYRQAGRLYRRSKAKRGH